MTAISVVLGRTPVLLVLCLVLAAVFLAGCDGDRPTPETESQPDPKPTEITAVHPGRQPTEIRAVQPNSESGQFSSDSEIHAGLDNPRWLVAPSLEEQIYDALDSTSMVVVRASLQSISTSSETVSGTPTTYRPVQELRFNVHEYLEGSGPNEIVVVVKGDRTFRTASLARRKADYEREQRNKSWDNQQAVLFVELGPASSGASGADGSSSARTAEFANDNPLESAWDYTVDHLSRAWLPALAVDGATGQSSAPEFITDGAKAPPPTIALADLKAKIASLKAELSGGADIAGFKECVRDRIMHERVYRAQPGGGLQERKTLSSSAAAGAEVYSYENTYREPKYNNNWLGGPDGSLFQTLNVDDDSSPTNGYTYMLSTARPLPAGEYRVHYFLQHHDYMPCNFKPDDAYLDWTVTVTAPTSTVHEAFFDPVAIGSAVGADASNGVLEPKAFTVGQVGASLQSLKWQGGSTTLSLSAAVSLSGHALDFIALDGTVAHSLDGGAAAVSGSTLTWSVATQPWKAGDKLMLRIRQGSPAPTPTPTPTPVVECKLGSGLKTLPWTMSDTALAECTIGYATARRIYYFRADQSGFMTVANTTPKGEAYLRLKEAAGFGENRANLTARIPVGQSAGANVKAGQWYALMLLGTADGQTISGVISGSEGLTSIR